MPEGKATRSSGALPIAEMEWDGERDEEEANSQVATVGQHATARSEKAGA